MGQDKRILREHSNLRTKIASLEASESAMYSASIVERAMVDCFWEDHEIMPLAKKKA